MINPRDAAAANERYRAAGMASPGSERGPSRSGPWPRPNSPPTASACLRLTRRTSPGHVGCPPAQPSGRPPADGRAAASRRMHLRPAALHRGGRHRGAGGVALALHAQSGRCAGRLDPRDRAGRSPPGQRLRPRAHAASCRGKPAARAYGLAAERIRTERCRAATRSHHRTWQSGWIDPGNIWPFCCAPCTVRAWS